jgi:hypothetical protein
MMLDENESQVLFESLWDSGYRPKNEQQHIGELRASKFHLEDMRTIAFNKLGIQNK